MPDIKSNIIKHYLLLFMQGFWFVLPIFILYFQNFNLSYLQIGELESAFTAFFFLLTIPCGAFSDLVSRKLSILIGTVMTAIGMIIMGLGSSYFAFLIGNLSWALGEGFLTARGAMLYDSVKQIGKENEYLKISGKANLFSFIPLILSGILGPIMFSIDPRSPWLVMSVLWFFSTILIFFMVEPDKSEKSNLNFKSYIKKICEGIKFTLKTKQILWIMMFMMFMSIPLSFFNEVISQPYYLEIGFQQAHFSIIFPIIYGVASLTASQSHKIEKLLGEKGSFIFIVLCHSIGLILMGLLKTPFILIVIVITYISRDFRWIYVDTYINKYSDSKIRATVISIISMAISLVLIFVFIVGGFLTENLGMFQTLLIMGLFTAISSVVLLIAKPKNKNRDESR